MRKGGLVCTESERSMWVRLSRNKEDCKDCCPEGSMVIDGFSDFQALQVAINQNNNAPICFKGDITSNYPISIFNRNIFMNANSGLTIFNNLTVENCNISSCNNKMWKGIIVDGNVLFTKNKILDGMNALFPNTHGKNIQINNCVFEKNYIGLSLYGENQYDIYGNTFNGSGNLKQNPIQANKPEHGIYATLIKGKLGKNGNESNANTLINYPNKIAFNITNGRELQIINFTFENNETGIQANGFSNRESLIIRFSRFGRLSNGIVIKEKSYPLICEYNFFKFINVGINAHGNRSNLKVYDNQFERIEVCGIFSNITNPNEVYIQHNRMENNSGPFAENGAGIILYNSTSTLRDFTQYEISNNYISKFSLGIFVQGYRILSGNRNNKIHNNTILLNGKYPTIANVRTAGYGIGVYRCEEAIIENNLVTFFSSNKVPGTDFVCIFHDWSANCRIRNNYIIGKKTPRNTNLFEHGIWGGSEDIGSPEYQCNHFSIVNNAFTFNWVQDQLNHYSFGDYLNPLKNSFDHPNVNHYTYAYYTNLTNTQYYFYEDMLFGNPYNPSGKNWATPVPTEKLSDNNIIPGVSNSNSFQTHCTTLNMPQKWKNHIAKDSLLASIPKQFEAKIELMRDILMDTTLLDSSIAYQQFYNKYYGTNIYRFAKAQLAWHDNDTLQTRTLLNNIIPDSALEAYSKEVLRIETSDSITAQDTLLLKDYVEWMNDEDGMQVRWAAALKFSENNRFTRQDIKHFYLILPEKNQTHAKKPLFATHSEEPLLLDALKIYPNPAQDFFIIEYSGEAHEAQVYNSLGQKVYAFNPQEEKQIFTKNWVSGLYILKIQGYEAIQLVVQH